MSTHDGKTKLFRYRLRGLHTDWKTSPTSSLFVNYHQLKGGQYTFEVQAAQIGASTNESFGPIRRIKIRVAPWLTPLAIAGLGLIATLLVVAFVYPITSRMREHRIANQKILESEKRVRVVLSSSDCELWHFHLSDQSIEREGALSHLVDLPTHTRFPIQQLMEQLHPDDVAAFGEKMRLHLLEQTPVYEHVYRMKTRDGRYAWLRSLGRVEARDENNRVSVVSGTTVDISNFKLKESELAKANIELNAQIAALERTQMRLNEAEKHRKLALWGAGCEFFEAFLDTQKLVRENQIDDLMANQKADDLPSYWDYLHPDDLPRFTEAFLQHVKGAAEFYDVTYRTKRMDGSWCWVQTRGRAVERNGEGRATVIAGTNYDVTDLKATELALAQSAEALEQRVTERTKDLSNALDDLRAAQAQLVTQEKMAALGGLVAGVAHEINTPLGIGVTAASHLSDIAQRLKTNLDSNQVRKSDLVDFSEQAYSAAELVSANLRRASELVRSFKQVAVDQASEERRVFELKSYLEDVLNSMRPNTKRFRHKIVLDAPELHIDSFPGVVYQLVSNLVLNALNHAFEAPFASDQIGEVKISTLQTAEHWQLIVADDGIGMSETMQKKAFEPFFTTKRGQGGSGLGLHIVFNLVSKVLNGQITVESAQGSGSRFIVQVPNFREEK